MNERAPLRIALSVLAVLAGVAQGVGSAPAASAASAYDAVVDLTFPVDAENWYSDSYDAPRGGGERVHMATDVMADAGAPIHAAVGGTISWITGIDKDVPSYGYMITIAGDDGRSYSYVHMGRQDGGPGSAYLPAMRRGLRVERGQQLGFVGCSGNASCSAPHLHFAISSDAVTDPYGTHRMNPYASLRQAESEGDLPSAVKRGDVASDPCAPLGSVPDGPVRRVAGADPVATSAAVARAGWSAADHVLVATAGDYADALAGAALAAEQRAPLLLVGSSLRDVTRSVIADLGVRRATILGGPAAVPNKVAEALDDTVKVDRIHGPDRYGTAAAVHGALRDTGTEVAVALGTHPDRQRAWPDAIAAGALAATDRTVPVLLVSPGHVPAATRAALRDAMGDGATRALVVGGAAAVPVPVADADAGLGLEVDRLAGEVRYATSLAVVRAAAARGAAADTLVAAPGNAFAEAVTAGGLAARGGGSLLLMPPCEVPEAVEDHVAGRYRDGWVVGNEDAVSERVREVLTDAMEARG